MSGAGPIDVLEAHSTVFVGRREEGAAKLHALSDQGVEVLRSEGRFGAEELDWRADLPAVELSNVLLRRAAGEVPSSRLVARFATCFLMDLPSEGFDLEVLKILDWIVAESAPGDWSPPPLRRRPRPWLRRHPQ
ncbi:MAG: hypothetical protein QM729_18570 [Solirubrobacterales bacterium]